MIKLHIARKSHQCTECSYHKIQKGDIYLSCVMPPWHEMNASRKSDPGGKRWLVIKACLRCADEFGLHNCDTRKQLERLDLYAAGRYNNKDS